MSKRIDEMYAFVAVDPADGDEGVTAFLNQAGNWMPMVGADQERMESLKTTAQVIATSSGNQVKLVKFSVREELETFEP